MGGSRSTTQSQDHRMQHTQGTDTRLPRSLGGISPPRRSRHIPLPIRLRSRLPSSVPIGAWLLIVSCVFAPAAVASGESGSRLVFETGARNWSKAETFADVTLNHVALSLSDRGSTRDMFSPHTERPERGLEDRERCPVEGYLAVMPDLRAIPGWVLSEIDECRPAKSSLRSLIPKIRLEGSLFSIHYGLEIDKVKKGLLIDYGAFTFGIGDSPTGGMIFSGASFGIARWVPGSRFIPDRIREGLQIDVGIRLPLDTIDVKEWRPNLGIGVKLLNW